MNQRTGCINIRGLTLRVVSMERDRPMRIRDTNGSHPATTIYPAFYLQKPRNKRQPNINAARYSFCVDKNDLSKSLAHEK